MKKGNTTPSERGNERAELSKSWATPKVNQKKGGGGIPRQRKIVQKGPIQYRGGQGNGTRSEKPLRPGNEAKRPRPKIQT